LQGRGLLADGEGDDLEQGQGRYLGGAGWGGERLVRPLFRQGREAHGRVRKGGLPGDARRRRDVEGRGASAVRERHDRQVVLERRLGPQEQHLLYFEDGQAGI